MIVTGSAVSFVIGTIISWETLALTGEFLFDRISVVLNYNRWFT